MSANAEVLELVNTIYDCAVDPGRWTETLERICGHVRAGCGAITLQDIVTREVRLVAQWCDVPEFSQAMLSAGRINPCMSAHWFIDIDVPFTTESLLGEGEWTKTRFYKEVPAQYGYYDAIMSVLMKSASRFGGLSLPYQAAQTPITEEDLSKVRMLAPHIRRAVTIADLLDARALRQDMLSATLDVLTLGIVLVDDRAVIVHANAAGLRLLEEGAAVRRDGDHISARDPKVAAALRDAVAKAAGAALDYPASGIAVPICAADGREFAAWVLPLDGGLRTELAAPFAASAAIFLRSLDGGDAPFPGELFVKRYGITPAECRVLMILTQGMSPREVADTLGISEPTVKTHLARLFQKTGTGRQADLMRLAMSALAPAAAL